MYQYHRQSLLGGRDHFSINRIAKLESGSWLMVNIWHLE